MKTYSVQYDDDSFGATAAPKPTVVGRTDSLAEAVALSERDRNKPYVLHVPSGLQRYLFEGRVVWLDSHGREHPEPAATSASR